MARWAVSRSKDYGPNQVVVRDFNCAVNGRVLCIIAREDVREAEQIAQYICDLLNTEEYDGIL